MAKVITIEIAGKNNEQIIFPPTQDFCRGRWNYSNGTRNRSNELRSLETGSYIPGIHVTIDLEKKKGRIYDPLLISEAGKKFLEEFNKKAKENPIFGREVSPMQTIEYNGLTNDDIKLWLFHMKTLVDSNLCVVINGEVPSREEIAKLPGKRLKDPGNSGSKKKDLLEHEFVDVV